MKVITYNLHKGRDRRGASMLAEAVAALRARAPDLLLCQEVFAGHGDAVPQCEVIAGGTGNAHVFGPNVFYPRGCHGNATFARMAIDHHVNIDVTASLFEKRGVLRTRLIGPAGPFDALNAHFSLTGRQRLRQLRRLVAALPSDPSVPVLVCGDFNDWDGELDRRVRRSGLLANALWTLSRAQRRTFPAARPLLGLDRIYYRGFEVRDVRVLRGEPWSRLSDHLPVEAVLEEARP